MTARARRVTYDPRGASSTVIVEIPHIKLQSLNPSGGSRNRWALAEKTRADRHTARWYVLSGVRPERRRLLLAEGMAVTITRLASGRLDDDNLAGSAKAVRDGIADAFGIDDRDERVTWLYGQERSSAGVWGARVTLQRRPAEMTRALLYQDDPVRFATEVLGMQLDTRQAEILKALRSPSAALRHVRALAPRGRKR